MGQSKARARNPQHILKRSAMTYAITHLARLSRFSAVAAVGVSLVAYAGAAQAQTADATRTYGIPAGSLEDALNQFGRQAGILLSFSPDMTAGLRSNGLRGPYTVRGGLAALLTGSGLQAEARADGGYALRKVVSAPGNDPATLPVVKVTGQNDAVAERVNPPTTVGSRIALTQREISQSVSVVTQDQIKQQNMQTLDQALKYTPGISVLNSDSQRFQYYSRGYPISSFQVDGAPVFNNPNMSGTASTSAPTLAMYDRVEVLRGADGLFTGFGSPGGTINLIRKRAPSEYQFIGELNGGTYNNRGGLIDVGGPLNQNGSVRGRVVGSYQDQDLTQDSTWKRDRQLYGTLEADLSSSTLLRMGASYSEMSQRNTWSGSPTYINGDRLSRSRYTGADWNRETFYSTDVFAQLEQKLGDGWQLKASADYTHNRYGVLNANFVTRLDEDGNGTMATTNKGAVEDNQSYDVNLSGPFTLFGRQHKVTVGASYLQMNEWQRTKYGPDGDDFFLTQANVNDIVFAKPTWLGLPTDTDVNRERTTQYGIYANGRFSLADPLTLVAGASLNWWKDTFRPDAVYNYDQYTKTEDSYNKKVVPYVALIYDLNDTYSVYTSYSKIFEPQNGARSADGELIPAITGNQYEAGIKGAYLNGRVNASLAVFQLTQKNRASEDANFPDEGFYIAQGKARSRGVEAQVSGEMTPGWTLNGGYTYTQSKYLDDSLDFNASSFTQIAPKHMFRVWTNYRLPGDLNRWQAGLGVNATSRTWRDGNGYTLQQGGYFTADARIAYQATAHTSVALNVTNLFDRKYYASFGGNGNVWWGDPRKVMLTMRVTY
jgi:outer-membrane receptor for ferric coprogen and ferric-rhodotorulic acid